MNAGCTRAERRRAERHACLEIGSRHVVITTWSTSLAIASMPRSALMPR
jgi:hypothetical protein